MLPSNEFSTRQLPEPAFLRSQWFADDRLGAYNDSDLPFGSRVYALLGKPRLAKRQWKNQSGLWVYTRGLKIARPNFLQHLAGEVTLAVSCLRNGSALFVCWDIDMRFRDRLSVIREVLERRGLADAAFATEGSDAARGKIILTLAHPIPQAQAVALARDVVNDAASNVLLGGDEKIDLFPRGGSDAGSVVRVLGRNQSRSRGRLEAPLDLHGDLSDLWSVVPAKIEPVTYLTPSSIPGMMMGKETWTGGRGRSERLLAGPYCGNGATAGGDLLSLAHAAIRRKGAGPAGVALLDDMCDQIVACSPEMSDGAREQFLRADARQRAFERAARSNKGQVRGAVDLLGSWQPLTRATPRPWASALRKATGGAWKVYEAGTGQVIRTRKNPHAFCIAYSQWADLAGYSDPSTCRYAVDEAEQAGLLFRLDRGLPIKGAGLPTLVTFVGLNETLQSAYDLGVETTEFQQRLRDRREKGLVAPSVRVVNGRIVVGAVADDAVLEVAA